MSPAIPHRVLLFVQDDPGGALRLLRRIGREAQRAAVCGVVYLQLGGKRSAPPVRRPLPGLAERFLRFLHACPRNPNGPAEFRLEDLQGHCRSQGRAVHVTTDLHAPATAAFARETQADVVVLGISPEQDIPEDLLALFPAGAIVVREQVRSQGVPSAIRRVEAQRDGETLWAASLGGDPLDTPFGLELKANLLTDDLIVRLLDDFSARPAEGGGGRIDIVRHREPLPQGEVRGRSERTRSAWKLLPRTAWLLTAGLLRNWSYRLRKRFPVTILYHHLVCDRPHHLGIPTEDFYRHLDFLRRCYRVSTLQEAIEKLRRGQAAEPTVVLTLDDGYAQNYVNLRAVTEALNLPVALFLSSGKITRQEEFEHDIRRGQRGFLPLTWDEVRHLYRSRCEVGSHTRSHFDCGSTDLSKLEDEIVGSKRELEEQLGEAIPFFSFPWGNAENMSPPAVALARRTYAYVFSALGGTNHPAPNGDFTLLKRRAHVNSLWELELALQSALEFDEERKRRGAEPAERPAEA